MSEASSIWTGKASNYARSRPTPPTILLDLLTQVIQMPRPELVVDLGCGTGLSTVLWGERAARVIGIEPSADMRATAIEDLKEHPYASNVEYREGFGQETGLPDGCADIVTCAQSFHWMEPTATLAEIARILRPGGLFAVCDYYWPPTLHWELDLLALEVNARLIALAQERGLTQDFKMWPLEKHLERIRESGHFRFTRELALHNVEQGDATRFLALMRSSSFSHMLQLTDQEIGFDRLSAAAHASLGSNSIPWYIGYRICIGVK